jgi:hypothetical protein
VLSADDVLGKAAELRTLVDRLKSEPDAWRDDAMLEQMVELAKIAGDIRENTLVPDQVVFRHDAFWTSHFGGCYVFVDERMTTVIGRSVDAPGFRRSRPMAGRLSSDPGDHGPGVPLPGRDGPPRSAAGVMAGTLRVPRTPGRDGDPGPAQAGRTGHRSQPDRSSLAADLDASQRPAYQR